MVSVSNPDEGEDVDKNQDQEADKVWHLQVPVGEKTSDGQQENADKIEGEGEANDAAREPAKTESKEDSKKKDAENSKEEDKEEELQADDNTERGK